MIELKLPDGFALGVPSKDPVEAYKAGAAFAEWMAGLNALLTCCRATDHAISSLLAVREGLSDQFLRGLQDMIRQAVAAVPTQEMPRGEVAYAR